MSAEHRTSIPQARLDAVEFDRQADLIVIIEGAVEAGLVPQDVGRDYIAGFALERLRREPVPDRLVHDFILGDEFDEGRTLPEFRGRRLPTPTAYDSRGDVTAVAFDRALGDGRR